MSRKKNISPQPSTLDSDAFVEVFRNSAPYINAFRGQTVAIVFSGKTASQLPNTEIIHDLALLNTLGIRLVIIHGVRYQVEEYIRNSDAVSTIVSDVRVTDDEALRHIKSTVGTLRLEIEALLSMGLADSPMAGAKIRVSSGNFVTAKPYGVRQGIDYLHTGVVRKIDHQAISRQLDDGAIVLLSPLGYSPTGEIFNLDARKLARDTAISINADKLIFLEDQQWFDDNPAPPRQLTIEQSRDMLTSHTQLSATSQSLLSDAIIACEKGVTRVHIIDSRIDGALLQELFTRDGIGTLINADRYEGTRQAVVDDVTGILQLITPLEEKGILVRRSREHLEMEIDHFYIVERDGLIIACGALYPFKESKMTELACLAVHPNYQRQGKGEELLDYLIQQAQAMSMDKIFALSTHALHWFQERGFKHTDGDSLPIKRQELYNYKRNSRIFIKDIS